MALEVFSGVCGFATAVAPNPLTGGVCAVTAVAATAIRFYNSGSYVDFLGLSSASTNLMAQKNPDLEIPAAFFDLHSAIENVREDEKTK
jgi:hypothetical protein